MCLFPSSGEPAAAADPALPSDKSIPNLKGRIRPECTRQQGRGAARARSQPMRARIIGPMRDQDLRRGRDLQLNSIQDPDSPLGPICPTKAVAQSVGKLVTNLGWKSKVEREMKKFVEIVEGIYTGYSAILPNRTDNKTISIDELSMGIIEYQT